MLVALGWVSRKTESERNICMQEVYQGAFSKPVPVRESEKQEWAEGSRIILGVATMASADSMGTCRAVFCERDLQRCPNLR